MWSTVVKSTKNEDNVKSSHFPFLALLPPRPLKDGSALVWEWPTRLHLLFSSLSPAACLYLCMASLRLLQLPDHRQPWHCWLVPLSFVVHLYLGSVPVDEIWLTTQSREGFSVALQVWIQTRFCFQLALDDKLRGTLQLHCFHPLSLLTIASLCWWLLQ